MVDICDLDLVGTELEQDGLFISLTREYFQQQVIDPQEASTLLQRCAIANLVGPHIVNQALEMKMGNRASIKRISGVPFLMIFKFPHQ